MALITIILGGETHYNEAGPYVVGGALTEIDECHPDLKKLETIIDDNREHTVITEYWLAGELVKRGAQVNLKTGIFADAFQADFGDS